MTLDDEISQIKTRCQFVYFSNIKLLMQFAYSEYKSTVSIYVRTTMYMIVCVQLCTQRRVTRIHGQKKIHTWTRCTFVEQLSVRKFLLHYLSYPAFVALITVQLPGTLYLLSAMIHLPQIRASLKDFD